MKIGVLAMQGAFIEHINILRFLGVNAIEVRKPEQLNELDGLVIPGGESTTIGKLLQRYDMLKLIRKKCQSGFPVFGTCAGLILLSKEVNGGLSGQPVLGVLSATTCRNAFGRQVDSFEMDLDIPELGKTPFRGIFIRAPIIKDVGKNVKILCKFNEDIIAVREGNILATAFHPELSRDTRFHQYFICMVMDNTR